jgi:hypothetical protein
VVAVSDHLMADDIFRFRDNLIYQISHLPNSSVL